MQKSFVFVIRVYWRQPKPQSLLSFFFFFFFLKKKKKLAAAKGSKPFFFFLNIYIFWRQLMLLVAAVSFLKALLIFFPFNLFVPWTPPPDPSTITVNQQNAVFGQWNKHCSSSSLFDSSETESENLRFLIFFLKFYLIKGHNIT
jgi:hypothetical protein